VHHFVFCIVQYFYCLSSEWSKFTSAELETVENNRCTIEQEFSCMSDFMLALYFPA